MILCSAPLAAAVLAVTHAASVPPRVIHAEPDHGDVAVSPDLTQIVVEFDQDMAPSGYSVCGGGPAFPSIRGKPSWKDSRTLLIPVTLAPGHDYALSINCPSASGFKSAAGEPAGIHAIQFRTSKPGDPPPRELTPADNAQALALLKDAIRDHYSYADLRVRDWPALWENAQDAIASARTPAQFARAAAEALAPADDVHLNLRAGDFSFGTSRTRAVSNFDLEQVKATVPGLTWKNDVVAAARIEGGPAYILIRSWPSDLAKTRPAIDALTEFHDAPSFIIDVRPNGGGDERAARAFASHFVTESAVYSRNEIRTPSASTGFSQLFDRTIAPSADEPHIAVPVAVLIGPSVVSSCESFALMMAASPRVTLIGATTRGSSGNPKPYDLGNGVTILVPSWRDYLPSGAPLEGRGIDPAIPADPGHLPAPDGVITAARTHLEHESP